MAYQDLWQILFPLRHAVPTALTQVADELVVEFDILTLASDELAMLFDVGGYVSDTLVIRFDIGEAQAAGGMTHSIPKGGRYFHGVRGVN